MKNTYLIEKIFIGLFISLLSSILDCECQVYDNGNINVINTSVPTLRISPDSRASSLGGIGIASSPDISSQHWNLAKYVFMDNAGGISSSFAPWVNKVPNKYLAYLVGYYKISDNTALSSSLTYNSLGETILTDELGEINNTFFPHEIYLDIGYSMKLNKNLSGGILFKYIHSNIIVSQTSATSDAAPSKSIAADISMYYSKKVSGLGEYSKLNLGISIANIGPPISYDKVNFQFLPTNIGIGSSIELGFSEANSITFLVELNKLLVPTSPIMERDSLIRGRIYPNSVVKGMINSFYDAPGIQYSDGSYSSVFREEMAEVILSFGVEYKVQNQVYFRSGCLFENEIKGNRKYLSMGIGVANPIDVNLAYIVSLNIGGNPYTNTFHLSLGYSF